MMRLGTAPCWLEVFVEKRDIWIGVYWTWKQTSYPISGIVFRELHIYVCLLPCLPLHVIWGQVKPHQEGDNKIP